MRLVADIETDGLLDTLTRLHCLVIREAGSRKILASCTDDPCGLALGYRPVQEGLSLLSEADEIVFHNGIRFDLPALKKLYPEWTFRGQRTDTFVIACFRWAHIKDDDFAKARKGTFPAKLAGSHSLAAWGHRLGVHKGEYTDWCKTQGLDPWSDWRPEMQTYCEQDTETTLALLDHIDATPGITEAAKEIEHELTEYLFEQERNGWPLNVEKAYRLNARLAARREELSDGLKQHFGWWYASNGITTPKRSIRRKGPNGCPEHTFEGAPYSKLKVVTFNPGSRDHIAGRLQKVYGWKPTVFTETGKPQVDEKTLKGFKAPIAKELLEFLLIEKRLGQLSEGKKAWLKVMTNTSPAAKALGATLVHHRVLQNSCVTHRAAHVDPNLAQVPKVTSPFGEECRELFEVPAGWVQIGADASGLELRCLAHYMARYDGGAYGRVVLEGRNEDGTDIHSVNRNALGWSGKEGRDKAKTWIYAYLYGAGDEKLGSIERPDLPPQKQRQLGSSQRKRFENKLAAIGRLSADVKARVGRGYLVIPDGRRTYIRHSHAALNSLLQSAGAIICKRWIVEFNRRLTERFGPQGWQGQWAALGWIHDEVQLAVRPEIAEEVREILVESIRYVGELFAWRCPLDGEAKIGSNWKETH